MRNLLLFLLGGAALLVAGCSGNLPSSASTREVVVSALAKDLGVGSNVTGIVLAVTAADMETITQSAEMVNGEATIELEVPIGEDRVFTMTAFDAEEVALYSGSRTADVLGGQITEIIIDLEPQVPMIKVTPIYHAMTDADSATFQVRIHNVDSLFGASFRLEFDSTMMSVAAFEAGDLFAGRDPIFFAVERENYLAVGYTLKGNQQPQGVSADATLLQVTFTAVGSGLAHLNIDPSTLQLVNWRGDLLPLDGVLYIEDGEVQIGAP